MNYSDVIYGIFAFFGENKEFTTERIRIHNGFYELANNNEYKDFFSDVTFSTSEEFHKSLEIDQCIDNLILSRLITASNPDLIKYQISPVFYKYYNENEKEFFQDSGEQIKKMSENLLSKVG
jgi:hypothetical protein